MANSRLPKPLATNQSPSTTYSSQTNFKKPLFCRQFSNTVVDTTHRAAHEFEQRIKRIHPLDRATTISLPAVLQDIKTCKISLASGPDGLTMLHIRHLEPRGIKYLTDLYISLSLQSADIPARKKATKIPTPTQG